MHPCFLTFEDELLGTVYRLLGDAVVQRRVSTQGQDVDLCSVSQKHGHKVAVGDLTGHMQWGLPIRHPVDGRSFLKEH